MLLEHLHHQSGGRPDKLLTPLGQPLTDRLAELQFLGPQSHRFIERLCTLRARELLALAFASSSLAPLRRRHFKNFLVAASEDFYRLRALGLLASRLHGPRLATTRPLGALAILSLLASKAMLRPEAAASWGSTAHAHLRHDAAAC